MRIILSYYQDFMIYDYRSCFSFLVSEFCVFSSTSVSVDFYKIYWNMNHTFDILYWGMSLFTCMQLYHSTPVFSIHWQHLITILISSIWMFICMLKIWLQAVYHGSYCQLGWSVDIVNQWFGLVVFHVAHNTNVWRMETRN